MEQYKQVLQKYLPEGTEDKIIEYLKTYRIHLHVTKSRVSKLGDFRPPADSRIHKITINHDLNPFAFLITLVHEIAHVLVWHEYSHRVKPHGKEWKKEFSSLLGAFLNQGLFPGDVESALLKYARKPLASSGADVNLAKALRKHDKHQGLTLEELPAEAVFSIHNGKKFKKLEKGRKRYRCLRLDNNRIYLVHPMTSVVLENDL